MVVVIGGIGMVGLAIQLNPASVAFLAAGALMIGGIHFTVRGFANPELNHVDLGDDFLSVSLFRPFRPISLKVTYSDIEGVEEAHKHRFPHGFLAWPYFPTWPHVDVKLRRSRHFPAVWGATFPWVKVMHLDVEQADRFVSALRARIEK